jgi:hypothetical protein
VVGQVLGARVQGRRIHDGSRQTTRGLGFRVLGSTSRLYDDKRHDHHVTHTHTHTHTCVCVCVCDTRVCVCVCVCKSETHAFTSAVCLTP